jgi:hypothetical protein
MTWEWLALAAGLTALVALGLLVAVLRLRSRAAGTARELDEARSETERLRSQVEEIARRLDGPGAAATTSAGDDVPDWVITDAGERPLTPGSDAADATPSGRHAAVEPGAVVAQRIDGRLFTDIVVRETVVKAASWTHGLRRALAPEVRNRIRFEVRREYKRARKDRRTEMKQALREYHARQRARGEDAA